MSRTHQLRSMLLLVLALFALPGVYAQQPPDQALFAQAQAALGKNAAPEAIRALEQLRTEFPTSTTIPQGTLWLFQCYLQGGDLAKAEPLWKEIFARWPAQDVAWQAIEINCTQKAATDPKLALTKLAEYQQLGMVPSAAQTKAERLRLGYLAKSDPAQLVTALGEKFAHLQQYSQAEDIGLLVEYAPTLYAALFTKKDFETAKAHSWNLQERIAVVGNPQNLAATETQAYFRTLAEGNLAECQAQVTPLMALIEWAEKPDELALPTLVAQAVYAPMVKGGQLKAAQTIHAQFGQAFAALGAGTAPWANAEVGSYLQALSLAKPEAISAELPNLIKGLATTTSVQEVASVEGVVRGLYIPMAQAGRFAEARAIYDAIVAAYGRLQAYGNQSAAAGNYMFPISFGDQDPKRAHYAAEVKRLCAGLATATPPESIATIAYNTIDAYGILFANYGFDETKAIHRQVLAYAARTKNPAEYADRATSSYLTAVLLPHDPQQFLAEARALVAVTPTMTAAQLQAACTLARSLYPVLLSSGGLEEARSMHRDLQAASTRLAAPQPQERQAYFAALAAQAPQALFIDGALAVQAATASTPPDLPTACEIALLLYQPLLKAGKVADAKAIHAQIQAAAATGKVETPQEMGAYLSTLAALAPDHFLPEAAPLITQLCDATDHAKIRGQKDLVWMLYAPLMKVGQLDEARVIHDKMQDALLKLGQADEAQADRATFSASISQEAVEAMFTLFKRALASNQPEVAKKWLANLTTIAPEHPRSVQARKMFKGVQDKAGQPGA